MGDQSLQQGVQEPCRNLAGIFNQYYQIIEQIYGQRRDGWIRKKMLLVGRKSYLGLTARPYGTSLQGLDDLYHDDTVDSQIQHLLKPSGSGTAVDNFKFRTGTVVAV